MDRVGVVFDEWRRLLKPRASGLLSMEELWGLVGELWLILNKFSTTRSIEAAIEGWLGPMGLPQDFWYDGDGFREAKAIGPSTRVKISSEHQLDADDLELIILQIANTDEQTVGAINVRPWLAERRLPCPMSEQVQMLSRRGWHDSESTLLRPFTRTLGSLSPA